MTHARDESKAKPGSRRPRGAKGLGRKLYESAVRQARTPALYASMGAPDTVEGRFELLTAHVILLIDRLRAAGLAEISQTVFDAYTTDLDGALREMGVGDLTVGKRMRELVQAFYGRAAGYRQACAALPDRGPLAALVARTVFVEGGDAAPLAEYFAGCAERLAATSSAELAEGRAEWAAA